jgi:hypothetical protein
MVVFERSGCWGDLYSLLSVHKNLVVVVVIVVVVWDDGVAAKGDLDDVVVKDIVVKDGAMRDDAVYAVTARKNPPRRKYLEKVSWEDVQLTIFV